MTVISNQIPTDTGSPAGLLGRAWRFDPTLTITILFHAALILAGLIGLLVDPRTILNAPVWAKTTKFAISISLYCTSLLWMLSYLRRWPRLAQTIGTITGFVLLIEIAVVLVQNILRGLPAHYNVATSFDGVMWSIMGTGIAVLSTVNILACILTQLHF